MSEPAARMTEARLAEFFAAWNRHDVEGATAFFAEDGVYFASFGQEDDGTSFRGRDAVRRGIRAFLDTYPDATYTDLRLFVSGDRGAAEWRFSGTPSEGPVVHFRGCDLFDFSGSQILVKDAFRKERSVRWDAPADRE